MPLHVHDAKDGNSSAHIGLQRQCLMEDELAGEDQQDVRSNVVDDRCLEQGPLLQRERPDRQGDVAEQNAEDKVGRFVANFCPLVEDDVAGDCEQDQSQRETVQSRFWGESHGLFLQYKVMCSFERTYNISTSVPFCQSTMFDVEKTAVG